MSQQTNNNKTLQNQHLKRKHHSLCYSISQRSRSLYSRSLPSAKRSGFSPQYRDFMKQNRQRHNEYSLEYNLAKRFESLEDLTAYHQQQCSPVETANINEVCCSNAQELDHKLTNVSEVKCHIAKPQSQKGKSSFLSYDSVNSVNNLSNQQFDMSRKMESHFKCSSLWTSFEEKTVPVCTDDEHTNILSQAQKGAECVDKSGTNMQTCCVIGQGFKNQRSDHDFQVNNKQVYDPELPLKEDCSNLGGGVKFTIMQHTPVFHTGIQNQRTCRSLSRDTAVIIDRTSDKEDSMMKPNTSEQVEMRNSNKHYTRSNKQTITCDRESKQNDMEENIKDLSKIDFGNKIVKIKKVRFRENVETINMCNIRGTEKIKDIPGKPIWKKKHRMCKKEGHVSSITQSEKTEVNGSKKLKASILEDALEKKPVSCENIVISQMHTKKRQKAKNLSSTLHKTRESSVKSINFAVTSVSSSRYPDVSMHGVKNVPDSDHHVQKKQRQFNLPATELQMKGSDNGRAFEQDKSSVECKTEKTSLQSCANVCSNDNHKVSEEKINDNEMTIESPERDLLTEMRGGSQSYKQLTNNRFYLEHKHEDELCKMPCHQDDKMEESLVKADTNDTISIDNTFDRLTNNTKGCKAHKSHEAVSNYVNTHLYDIDAGSCNHESEIDKQFHMYAKNVAVIKPQDNSLQHELKQTLPENVLMTLGTKISTQADVIKQNNSSQNRISGLEMSPYLDKAIDDFLESHADFFFKSKSKTFSNGNCSSHVENSECEESNAAIPCAVDEPVEKTESPPPILTPFDGYIPDITQSQEEAKPVCGNIKTNTGRIKPFWEMKLASCTKFDGEKSLFESAKHFLGEHFEELGKMPINVMTNITSGEHVTVSMNSTDNSVYEKAENKISEHQREKLDTANPSFERKVSIAKLRCNKKYSDEPKSRKGRKRRKPDNFEEQNWGEPELANTNKTTKGKESDDLNSIQKQARNENSNCRRKEKISFDLQSVCVPFEVDTNQKQNEDGEAPRKRLCTSRLITSKFEKKPKLELIDVMKTFINVGKDSNTPSSKMAQDTFRESSKVYHLRNRKPHLQLFKGTLCRKKKLGPKTWNSLHCTLKSKKKLSKQSGYGTPGQNDSSKLGAVKKDKKKVNSKTDVRRTQTQQIQSLSLRENLKTIPRRISEDEACSDSDTLDETVFDKQVFGKIDTSNEDDKCKINKNNGTGKKSGVQRRNTGLKSGKEIYNNISVTDRNKAYENSPTARKEVKRESGHHLSKTTCRFCGTEETSRRALQMHIEEAHPYRCTRCSLLFPDKESSSNHFWSHQKAYYRCSLCDVNFISAYVLELHLKKREHLEKEQVQRQAEMNMAIQSILEDPYQDRTSALEPGSDPSSIVDLGSDTDILCQIASSFSLLNSDGFRSS